MLHRKIKRKPSKPGLRYSSVALKDLPSDYFNVRVVTMRKVKGKSQIVVVIQAEKRINL